MISPCTHLGEAIDPSVCFGFVIGLIKTVVKLPKKERRTPPPPDPILNHFH